MKTIFFSLVFMTLSFVTTCVAQTMDLFTWQNGTVIPSSSSFIKYDHQPSAARLAEMQSKAKLLHSIPVQCQSGQYKCNVQILGTQGIDEDESHCYYQFELRDQYQNTLLFTRRGSYLPLTTTRALSKNYGDLNYFRKIDLDNDTYALIFCGWITGYDDELGEMIIVIVSKNVATLVYDGPAAAITPADFNSGSFSMDIVTDGTDLFDSETGLLNITPQTVGNRTKYRIYKSGNILKVTSWTTGNGPVLP